MKKVVFMGSPQFAVPTLSALIKDSSVNVSLVISQPDKPAGRKRQLTPTPVKSKAQEHNIKVETPHRLSDSYELLHDIAPDFMVVVAYGQILKKEILEIPKYACLNVHASILPRWRGAAPIHRAILAGDDKTGVSIMQMDEGLDTGPVYCEKKIPIEQNDTSASLFLKLSELGANKLITSLDPIMSGDLKAKPQSSEGVTYAEKLTKAEGEINWSFSAPEIDRQIRAFTPWPGTTTTLNKSQIKIKRGAINTARTRGAPGEVVHISEESITVSCGEGELLVFELQTAGRASMTVQEWLNGNELNKGDRFSF